MMLSNAMMMSEHFIDYEGRPARPELDAELLGFGPLFRLYPAAEGWVFVAAPQPRDFERLCSALELGALPSDPRFANAESRTKNSEMLAAALGDAIAKQTADQLESKLTSLGIACVRADEGPFASWIFAQDWAREQGLVAEAPDSSIGPYPRYGPPLISERPAPLRGAFDAGTNTRAVLEELGYSPAETNALFTAGVVSEPATES